MTHSDGSGLPSRDTVIDISKTLRLGPEATDQLLELANYEKLSGDEVVQLVTSNLSFAGLTMGNPNITHNELSNLFSSTGPSIGGSIISLDEKVHTIENTLGAISTSVLELKSGKNPDIAEVIESKIKPIAIEVKAIREEIVPQLEETKSQISRSDEFLRKHADFFISAVEGEGAVKIIKSELESVDKRLGKVEGQLNVSRDRAIAIASIIIALISACIACYQSWAICL